MNSIIILAAVLAGFGKVDITPPVGAFMPGYFSERIAVGATTPLELCAVAFSDGSSTGIVVSADNLHLTAHTITNAQRRLTKEYGILPEQTFIASTHIHTSAATSTTYYKKVKCEAVCKLVDQYGEEVESKIVDAVAAALSDLKPSQLLGARTKCPGISFIRRFRMKDGTVKTNPDASHVELIDHALGEADDEVQVVRIHREGGADIALVNFQTHPDTVGGLKYHWDWPGQFRQYFERALADGTRCLFLNGAQGDTNHHRVLGEREPWRAKAYDEKLFPQVMGARLAGAALSVWSVCQPIKGEGKVRGKITIAKVAANRPSASVVKAIEMYDSGISKEDILKAGLGLGYMEVTAVCGKNSNARKLMNGPEFFEMPISTLTIGNQLAFAGFPGEPFTEIGRKVKDASPFAMTFVGCLVNDSVGYLPSASASLEGGYEVVTSRFGAACGDTLVKTQLDNLNTLK